MSRAAVAEPAAPAGVARDGRVPLVYEVRGTGPAVLLVAGFGATRDAWARTVAVLERRFRVITFDHRGVGESGASWLPYTVGDMAADAVAVLDAAGEERAHVYGLSLGGMVAQELVLRHPERVGALVLGATTPGGPRSVPGSAAAVSFFARAATMPREEAVWAAVPHLYGERTRRHHGQRIADDIAGRLPHAAGTLSRSQQLLAAAGHSTYDRLGAIATPTLIVHGGRDVIVPADNARLLAARIPDAELHVWAEAGHLYVTDEPRADVEVAWFLRRHAGAVRPGRRGALGRLWRGARRALGRASAR
jgi:3-oxoadipate enol-lactonase